MRFEAHVPSEVAASPVRLPQHRLAAVRELVVGFDLDMTLIDSRPGIAATWAELARRTGADLS